jgi:hypothetical protein
MSLIPFIIIFFGLALANVLKYFLIKITSLPSNSFMLFYAFIPTLLYFIVLFLDDIRFLTKITNPNTFYLFILPGLLTVMTAFYTFNKFKS